MLYAKYQVWEKLPLFILSASRQKLLLSLTDQDLEDPWGYLTCLKSMSTAELGFKPSCFEISCIFPVCYVVPWATICDAVSQVVWRTQGLDCYAVDLLLFWRWVSGRMEPMSICVQQIKYSRLGWVNTFFTTLLRSEVSKILFMLFFYRYLSLFLGHCLKVKMPTWLVSTLRGWNWILLKRTPAKKACIVSTSFVVSLVLLVCYTHTNKKKSSNQGENRGED